MRLLYRILGSTAWVLCEIAFKTDCWGPFAWFYRAGCYVYHLEIVFGERHGFLVPNPRAHETDQPRLIEAP